MILGNPFTRLEGNIPLPKFDCGDEDLNEFFHKDAIKWQEELMSPKSFWRKIKKNFPHQKHRNDYPAVKIGRFAVDKHFSCQPEHWGTKAMNFIKEWMVSDNKTGCCFLTVDAYPKAVTFYLKNGFKFLGNDEELRYNEFLSNPNPETTIAMYFNLKGII